MAGDNTTLETSYGTVEVQLQLRIIKIIAYRFNKVRNIQRNTSYQNWVVTEIAVYNYANGVHIYKTENIEVTEKQF